MAGPKRDAIAAGATAHGRDLLRQEFTLSQVVHDYGDVCQTITDLPIEMNVPWRSRSSQTTVA